MKTTLARSTDGRTVHRADCRHARLPWRWADDKSRLDVWIEMCTLDYRACRVCRPLAQIGGQ